MVGCGRPPSDGHVSPAAADPPAANTAGKLATGSPTTSRVDAPARRPQKTRSGVAAGLHYYEVVTGGADIDARLPMLVALHGLGDRPETFSSLLRAIDLPARLIFPRALDEYEGGGFSWFAQRARDPQIAQLASGITRAAHAVAATVHDLLAQRSTRGRPVVTGFSQGGMVTFALATSHPELFSAAFPVGGWLPPPLWPEHLDDPRDYPPIVALHGDIDRAVALGPTQAAISELRRLGFAAQLHVYPGIGHAIPPPMRHELLQLVGDALRRT